MKESEKISWIANFLFLITVLLMIFEDVQYKYPIASGMLFFWAVIDYAVASSKEDE